ncbi:MAG: hypothetical protein M0P09_00620 [Acholeplasmataceae bacterium]|nr:hypothetical protein [Acholeplasmataceae bacterium]
MRGLNKKGIIPAMDEYGYRKVVLGALNVFSRKGEYYALEGAEDLFKNSSIFMRKVEGEALRGELGHPIPTPGMSEEQFSIRIRQVIEPRICLHIRRVWLDHTNVKDDMGRTVIAIMGEVAPSGELGHILEKAFNNPYENVAFSIRCFSDVDRSFGGAVTRKMREIVTWDYVSEPGIKVADKYYSPSLENNDIILPKKQEILRADTVDNLINRKYSRSFLRKVSENKDLTYSEESVFLTTDELFTSLGWNNVEKPPAFHNW